MTLYDYARGLMASLQDPMAIMRQLKHAIARNSGYREEVQQMGLEALLERIRKADNAAVRRGEVAPTVARAEVINVKAMPVAEAGEGGDHSANEAQRSVVPALSAVARPTLGQALRAASYPGRLDIWCESQEARARGLRVGDVVQMDQEQTRRIAKEELRVKSVRTATEYAGVMMWRAIVEWNEKRERPLLESDLERVELEARSRFGEAARPQLQAAK